ncbi:MAG TPA: hypothetical protein VMT57_08155, partial [Candidatus Thermoplasmatota archaeon]|nr:hypothetical protein [Candidatus Thermoplasmatota archaeon]
MNRPPRFASQSPPRPLEIFSIRISDEDLQLITASLRRTYGDLLRISIGGTLALPMQAYNPSRDQYDAEVLLDYLLTVKHKELTLWVIPEDLYARDMNFLFGLASPFRGALLSLYRLPTTDLKEKEAIHEVGHVMGLKHCPNRCVMRFSNSL